MRSQLVRAAFSNVHPRPDPRPRSPATPRLVTNQALRRAAYCDVDGTLADTTIVSPLISIKSACLAWPARLCWLASLVWRGPWWLLLDQCSRQASNNAIYANYNGLPLDRIQTLAQDYYVRRIQPALFGQARARLEVFRAEGTRVVLVTGGLDLLMEPLARDLGADCLAARLDDRGGVCTGQLATGALTGARKAAAIRQHAVCQGIDLAHSYALGDALGDLPMLECVGFPMAVNPDRRLAKVAVQRGWPMEWWTR